jgi:hypothetical protein
MKHFKITKTEEGFHLEGFPDAIKIVALGEHEAKRLADLALHKADLVFADACLEGINNLPTEPIIYREALWRSAIVHFLKCFGNGARFQLAAEKIYKKDPPEAMIAFNYFKNLRNKYVVHDEKSYTQSIPGAILNNGEKDYKIEKIVCFSAFGATLEQDNFSNLKLLVQKARAWVEEEFEALANRLTDILERDSYDSLMAREPISYTVPTIDEVNIKRTP